jgi:hypothetical protein
MFKIIRVVAKVAFDSVCLMISAALAVAVIDYLGDKLDKKAAEKKRADFERSMAN